MTQLVEVALTGCGPSHPSAKAVAESAAATIKPAIESILSHSLSLPYFHINSYLRKYWTRGLGPPIRAMLH